MPQTEQDLEEGGNSAGPGTFDPVLLPIPANFTNLY